MGHGFSPTIRIRPYADPQSLEHIESLALRSIRIAPSAFCLENCVHDAPTGLATPFWWRTETGIQCYI
jgi:hypothetical protein